MQHPLYSLQFMRYTEPRNHNPEQEVLMTKRKQAVAESIHITPSEESAPPVAATATLDPATEEEQPTGERKTAWYPDPREWKSVSLGSDRDSPRLRLLRSHRFNQMQIRSDEEIPEAYREQLKAAGWTERPEEGIWTKQLPPRPKAEGDEQKPAWPTVVEAERLFQDIAKAIRADKGLPSVAQERTGGTPF
jgi:hypothetical protein